MIQPGYTALLVTGLMVPVAGAISSFFTLSSSGVAEAARLAVTVPITELSANGAYPVCFVLFGLAQAWVVGRIFPARSARQIVLTLIAMALASVVFTAVIATLISVTLAVSLTAFSGVVFLLGRFERYRPIRGRALAAALVSMYVLAAVVFGYTQSSLTPLVVDAPTAPSGYAVRVGEDTDWLYLVPCDHRDIVVQVPKASIVSINWAPRPRPSDFFAALTRTMHTPSIYFDCP
jgi:hypothetical protein